MDKIWSKYKDIQDDLKNIVTIMEKNVKCSDKTIEAILTDMIRNEGKMLRPAFLLLAGKFGSYDSKKLCPLGATIEMLHMATLIHDDIVDNAIIRRGKPTIQKQHGKIYAVFIGDFLFSQCFNILTENTTFNNLKKVSSIISRICRGEINQFSFKFNKGITVKQYFKLIAAKTALLFALSFYIGSSESGCSEKLSKHLGKIGFYIGMAFQIIDDILDYTGNENITGKPLCNDLKQGIFTLPLIFALKADKGELNEMLLKKFFNDDDIQKIVNLTAQLNGISKARDVAKKYTQKAFKQISDLPDCESKEILKEVAQDLLYRNY